MSLWLTTFIVSGSAILAFIIFKAIHEKFSILIFWPGVRNEVEVVLARRQQKINDYINLISSKNFYILLHYLINILKRILVRIHSRLDRKSHRLVNLIKGKQTIETRKKSSYFLHDIASYKDRFRKW